MKDPMIPSTANRLSIITKQMTESTLQKVEELMTMWLQKCAYLIYGTVSGPQSPEPTSKYHNEIKVCLYYERQEDQNVKTLMEENETLPL